MIKLKKFIWPVILGILLALEVKNIDTITDYVVSKLDNTKEVVQDFIEEKIIPIKYLKNQQKNSCHHHWQQLSNYIL